MTTFNERDDGGELMESNDDDAGDRVVEGGGGCTTPHSLVDTPGGEMNDYGDISQTQRGGVACQQMLTCRGTRVKACWLGTCKCSGTWR